MPITRDPTTIQVERKTREQLKLLGSKGETYNDIILRLLKSFKEKNDAGRR